jgi:hypothetical protein
MLKEVIDHYNSGGQYAGGMPISLNLVFHRPAGCIRGFLHTLTDSSFVNNEDYWIKQ